MTTARPWMLANEGYYGPPLTHDQRSALITWLGANGYTGYAYSPKDDPYHRDRWRDPYPGNVLAEFAELHATCLGAGVELMLAMSPGLDWRHGDAADLDALTAKMQAFYDIGVRTLSVNWDDVPGTGASAGTEHGGAVAHVVSRLPSDVRWLAAPVDYAVEHSTPYLDAFASALPEHVGILWTGASVVTPHVSATTVAALRDRLRRPIYFAENYPVNDVVMEHVLHLGPAPQRDAAVAGMVEGVLANFMHRPLASRTGLRAIERFWSAPTGDRTAQWLEAVRTTPGLEPLARACWSWVSEPGPDPYLVELADAALHGDTRLREYLEAGCRADLPAELTDEVSPWLDQWDVEAAVMLHALDLLQAGRIPSVTAVWRLGAAWRAATVMPTQVFGIRFAMYPVTRRDGDRLVAAPGAIVTSENLTDRLVRSILQQVIGS